MDENALLVEFAKRGGFSIVGVNVKDAPAAARQFLNRYGNPFSLIGADANGRGQILYKHIGPITQADLESKILPAIEAAKK